MTRWLVRRANEQTRKRWLAEHGNDANAFVPGAKASDFIAPIGDVCDPDNAVHHWEPRANVCRCGERRAP